MESTYLIVVAGAIVAGFVQGLSGFAFGLVAMSFWAWVLDPKLAAALAVFGALTGQLVAVFSVRRAFDLKLLLPFVAGGLLGIPIGVAILPALNVTVFKAVLGTLLIIWCPAMLFSKQLPKITAGGAVANGLVGMAGGVMGGLGGFTGTLPTLWCTLRGYDRDSQRAIIQNFNLSILMATMLTYTGTGMLSRDMLPYFAVVAPAMLIPTFLGTRLYLGISDARFRQLVLGLLTVSGVALLAASVPKLLA